MRKKRARVGKPLRIAWKVKLEGGKKNLALHDVWLSRDGGATFPELLATGLGPGPQAQVGASRVRRRSRPS